METFTPNRAGGAVYDHLIDCMSYLKTTSWSGIKFSMNGVTITVYKDSSLSDLCDKWDMQRNINRLSYNLYNQS